MPRILYFHGFASSPRSQKVTRFRELLEPEGFVFDAPDLNVPSFETLDFDAVVALGVQRGTAAPPDVIVGSSLGSLVALAVARAVGAPLVLIAPPLGMAAHWIARLPPGDPITVFNYARNADAPIHRAFFEQMGRVDADRDPPSQAVTVVIGRNDETVPFDGVLAKWREWEASGRLAAGSSFIAIAEGDHGLVSFAGLIAEEIRKATARKPAAARSRGGSP